MKQKEYTIEELNDKLFEILGYIKEKKGDYHEYVKTIQTTIEKLKEKKQ